MKKLLFVLIIAVSCTACKKDNAGKIAVPAAPSVLGTWTVSEASVVASSNFTFGIGAKAFTFNSDGTVLEDFGSNSTVYNYTLSSSDGVNYISFNQSASLYDRDYIRTLNNEKYIITSTSANSIVLSREGPLNDGSDESFLTVYSMAK